MAFTGMLTSWRRLPRFYCFFFPIALIIVVGLIYALFLYTPSNRVETNERLAHDPTKPRRAPRVYDERIEGSRYESRDLGLAIEGPKDWKMDLGVRQEETPAYEGLVVKMEPDAPVDPATQVRPIISVVKRTLAQGESTDSLDYIRAHLLEAKKTVVEQPAYVEVSGTRWGSVAYEMPSGSGKIRIVQHVHINEGQAFIVSTMAPAATFEKFAPTYEAVFGSLQLAWVK